MVRSSQNRTISDGMRTTGEESVLAMIESCTKDHQPMLDWNPFPWGSFLTSKPEKKSGESFQPASYIPKPIGFEREQKKTLKKSSYASVLKVGLQILAVSVAFKSDGQIEVPNIETVKIPPSIEEEPVPIQKTKSNKYRAAKKNKKIHSPTPSAPTVPVIGSASRYACLKVEEIKRTANMEMEKEMVKETVAKPVVSKKMKKAKSIMPQKTVNDEPANCSWWEIVMETVFVAAFIYIYAVIATRV